MPFHCMFSIVRILPWNTGQRGQRGLRVLMARGTAAAAAAAAAAGELLTTFQLSRYHDQG